MKSGPVEQRLVPRHPDPGATFLRGGKELGLLLGSIVPSHQGLVEETSYYDPNDGSTMSYRVDRMTLVPHIAISGTRAEEFREWAIAALDCWTMDQSFALARRALESGDVDDMVDALLVLFISCPPAALITDAWIELALEFLRHEDADVRDSAVAGAFFGFWRHPMIQAEIGKMLEHDPSEAVRSRAAVLEKGWRTS